MVVGDRVEVLDEVHLVVEIAIRLAPNEGATVVVLADVRSAVEVRVDPDFAQPSVAAVHAPDIGPPVTVSIFGADIPGAEAQRCGDAGADQQAGVRKRPSSGIHPL